MGILVQIDTTGNYKLEHACFEVWATPGILHGEILLADDVHDQMTRVTVWHTHAHTIGVFISNIYTSRSVVSAEPLSVHSGRTCVYMNCNVVADEILVNCTDTYFIHHIEILVDSNIVCVDRHTVV